MRTGQETWYMISAPFPDVSWDCDGSLIEFPDMPASVTEQMSKSSVSSDTRNVNRPIIEVLIRGHDSRQSSTRMNFGSEIQSRRWAEKARRQKY
jgi:hypothetical protein